ncbi:MAG TPA: M48 family metalloprotease [Planctomycetota bacterium]|nr:M48 family metalloprotease [Planctomycetota bacterium]
MKHLRVAVLLALASCGAPAPAPLQEKPVAPKIDPKDPMALYALSEQVRAGIEANSRVSEDAGATRRVESLGGKLSRVCDNPLMTVRFVVLDNTLPNAVSLPRGHVFVNQGLAARLSDDAHLAFVLGHELAHICLRHSAGLLQAHAFLRSLGKEGADLQSLLGAFRREEELEADRYGLLYAVRAGFPLDRALGFFDGGISGEPDAAAAASSHPPADERKRALAAFGDKLMLAYALFEEAGRAYRSSQYDRAIERLTGFLDVFPNSTAGLTNLGAANLRKAVRFLEALPEGLADELLYIPVPEFALRRTPEPVYVQRAIQALEKASALDPRWTAADINLAAIHIREGRPEEARRALDRASRFVDADPRAAAVLQVHLGNLDMLKPDLDGAAAHYEKARALDPTVGAAIYDLALVRGRQGRRDDAVAQFTAIAASPEWNARAASRLEALGAPAPEAGKIKRESSLAGVLLGAAPEDVRAAFGAPTRGGVLTSPDGQEWSYEGGAVRILFSLDAATGRPLLVEAVTVSGGAFRTKGGIGAGDPVSRLKEKYGDPERDDRLHGQWAYSRGTLLFTVEGDRVSEITIALTR